LFQANQRESAEPTRGEPGPPRRSPWGKRNRIRSCCRPLCLVRDMHIAFPYRRLYASPRVSVTAYALIGSKISFPEISGSTHSCRASIRTL